MEEKEKSDEHSF